MEPNQTMTDAAQSEQDTSPPMIKEETTKDDGRTLIYYSFPETPDTEEAAHV
ncbi:MAG: hypothetical protein M3Y13_10090 [Armatimonadota bacterium]|nr:hypothetical protein [Armatimonadota bacterium]